MAESALAHSQHDKGIQQSAGCHAANKADLEEQRAVSTEEGQAYATENGLHFVETSAKTAANVSELFMDIARKLPKAEPAAGGQQQGGIVLSEAAPASNAVRRSACC